MMQLLSLVAMEPPVSQAVRAYAMKKSKCSKSIRPFSARRFSKYGDPGSIWPGLINGEYVIGLPPRKRRRIPIRTSKRMSLSALSSTTGDGMAFRFICAGGKRLAKRATEIAITFKNAPDVLFQHDGKQHDPNVLVIRIQPDEGIALKINCKVPGPSSPIQPVKMDFRYGSYFGRPLRKLTNG